MLVTHFSREIVWLVVTASIEHLLLQWSCQFLASKLRLDKWKSLNAGLFIKKHTNNEDYKFNIRNIHLLSVSVCGFKFGLRFRHHKSFFGTCFFANEETSSNFVFI